MTDQAKVPAVTRETRREELHEMSFDNMGGNLMVPTDGRDLMDKANLMSGAGFMVKDIYRNNPGACAALIMVCAPYGFNPFQVSWKTYKASKNEDAPIAYEAQLVNSMVNVGAPITGRLKYNFSGEGEKRICHVTAAERETGEELSYDSPEIGKIKIKNSPLWKSDPDMQLGYYSGRNFARRHFPEMLLGVYTRDELDQAPRGMKDASPEAQNFKERLEAAKTQEMEAKAKALDDKPEDPIVDAEIIPDEGMDQTDHEVDDETIEQDEPTFDEDAVDPFSDEYTEGVKANQAALTETHCPHTAGTLEWNNWLGGWRFFEGQKGGEE